MHINFNDLFLKMQEQLESNQAALDDVLLIELIGRIRPIDPADTEEINHKVQALLQALLITPHAVITLQTLQI